MTLIEPGKRPVLVEVKAKRLPDYGLAFPGSSAFKALDELITKTVIAGVQKAQDLSTNPPGPHASVLTAASAHPGLVVVVYGESVPNFDGVFRNLIGITHPLHTHLGNFLPLSIAEYEHHLEVARERGESVIDLLQKSAEEFKDRHMLRMTSHSHLGDAWPKDPFTERFLRELLQRLSTPAASGPMP